MRDQEEIHVSLKRRVVDPDFHRVEQPLSACLHLRKHRDQPRPFEQCFVDLLQRGWLDPRCVYFRVLCLNLVELLLHFQRASPFYGYHPICSTLFFKVLFVGDGNALRRRNIAAVDGPELRINVIFRREKRPLVRVQLPYVGERGSAPIDLNSLGRRVLTLGILVCGRGANAVSDNTHYALSQQLRGRKELLVERAIAE